VKIIATIDADLERTPLGTRSRLTEPLGGQAILRRTADRLRRCTRVDELIVTFPEKQGAAISAILDGAGTTLRSRPERHPPYRSLVQTARKWSLDGWRGGVGGSCAFDEYTDTELLAVLANDVKADAVVVVPPGAALIDPALVDAMVEHFVQTREEMRMTFAQTPPGLSPIIYRADLLAQLAQSRIPPGWTLAYKPDSPSADLAMRTCCFTVGQGLRHAGGLAAFAARGRD
jgi:spore coat polysaccharide biosynthesis protein SpsF (cytidylyltransferase family)